MSGSGAFLFGGLMMPANHCKPHTAEAKAKISASRKGKPHPHRRRRMVVVDGVERWSCGRCQEFFPRDSFHKNKRTLLGLTSECKRCHNRTSILSRDKDNRRVKNRIYEANRRARKSGESGRVQGEDLQKLEAILGQDCLKCHSQESVQWDHVVPLAKGGRHYPVNLQPLCRKCNEIKHTRYADYRTMDQRSAIESIWVIGFERTEDL